MMATEKLICDEQDFYLEPVFWSHKTNAINSSTAIQTSIFFSGIQIELENMLNLDVLGKVLYFVCGISSIAFIVLFRLART